jgi:hypothetical protein
MAAVVAGSPASESLVEALHQHLEAVVAAAETHGMVHPP